MKKFDAVIIGFGKGGKTLAVKLAGMGKKVAVVEKSEEMYGGTCINVGCIPSKSLVQSAKIAKQMNMASFEEKSLFYKQAIEEKRRLTAMLRKKNFDKLNDHADISVIHGTASFLTSSEIKVETNSGEQLLSAEKIYINTGSKSVVPNIPGVENNSYVLYSDSMMELDRLPEKLVIIGGGYIGLEFASMYANFGSLVTVLQDKETFLPREDEDIAGEIKNLLEAQGVQFRLGAQIEMVSENGTVSYQWNGISYQEHADAVLAATGRKPNTETLNLSAANVQVNNRGGILTDVHLETTQKGIYALGDVTGGLQFTYVSLDDYRVLMSGIGNGEYTLEKRKNVPYSVFIATPYSRVGLNEKEAKAQGLRYRTVKLPAAAIPKAQVLKEPSGILKALIDLDTNQILGAMLLCEASYEMINIVKLAMDLHAEYTVLQNQIFTHPTMSEALNDLFQ